MKREAFFLRSGAMDFTRVFHVPRIFVCGLLILVSCIQAPRSYADEGTIPRKVNLDFYFNPGCSASQVFFNNIVRPLENILADPRVSFSIVPVRLNPDGDDIRPLALLLCEAEASGVVSALKRIVPRPNVLEGERSLVEKGGRMHCKDIAPFYRYVVRRTAPSIRKFEAQYAPRLLIQGVDSEEFELEGIRAQILEELSKVS